MKNIFFILFCSITAGISFSQKEVNVSAPIKKVTVFFTGAQIEHEHKVSLQPGKQEVVFQKLTDFVDPNTVQVKAQGDMTILSVRTRKNYEDEKISNEEIKKLNAKRKELDLKDQQLRDEYTILELDKNLLMRNRDLKGNEQGVKMTELKDAYAFMHQKIAEITSRETAIYSELESIQKQMNQLEQEIISQRSKPVINYSEVVVEVDVEKATNAEFTINYLSPRATWKPYYDMRSDGIGKPVKLEAKANVSQNTGIEWKNIDMVLSTNDPYQNAQEPTLNPWYLYYNNYPQQKQQTSRPIPVVDYSGEKISGEVIDASTGEPLSFAKVAFYNNPNINVVTNFDGKFEITVPKGETWLKASFVGYGEAQQQITSPYLKFFLTPEGVVMEEVSVAEDVVNFDADYEYDKDVSTLATGTYKVEKKNLESIPGVQVGRRKRNSFGFFKQEQSKTAGWNYNQSANGGFENKPISVAMKKDMRVEYTILSKMSIPTDGMDHRVNIASFDLTASYEYHAVPKLDPSVYLAAQVTGWEKLNLMSGESNIYFDGTFMGKSYLDVNSTKDTLSFSFGKDNKISMERTRVKEKSKSKTIGSRQHFEVTWEIKVKNNGGANIPLIIKDQFPISNNAEIKVKHSEVEGAKIDDKTKIITWSFLQGISGIKTMTFDYSVDYQSGMTLYIE